MKPGIAIVPLLVFALQPSAGSSAPAPAVSERGFVQGPRLSALESRLFELTNGERRKFGLPPLRLSPELAAAARRHSSDMAGRNVLSHNSSTGGLLQDRLTEAGIYYAAAGENIANTSIPEAELINRSFLASPEHRKNILDPEYDTIGIGAVQSRRGSFFVTEDFIARLEVTDTQESTRKARQLIQEIRRQQSVSPLAWNKKAGALAREMAQARAAGRKMPAVPASLGEATVLTVMTPRLADLEKQASEIGRPVYWEAGLGLAFTRTREDPGGAYFVVLVLLPETRHPGLTDRGRNTYSPLPRQSALEEHFGQAEPSHVAASAGADHLPFYLTANYSSQSRGFRRGAHRVMVVVE